MNVLPFIPSNDQVRCSASQILGLASRLKIRYRTFLFFSLEHFPFMLRLHQQLLAMLLGGDPDWQDGLMEHTKDIIMRNGPGGRSKLTLDQLTAGLVPVGRAAVPVDIRDEIKEQIRDSLRRQHLQE